MYNKCNPMFYLKNYSKQFKLSIVILFFSFIQLQVLATIYYVKPTATGTGIGSSWANASSNLQAMINAANPGDQVWVAGGTYIAPYTVSGPSFYYSFVLKNGVELYGGFSGSETTLNQRNYQTNETILAGNGYTVVKTLGSITRATILDGFSITNGTGGSLSPTDFTGGFLITSNSSPIIQHCKFYNNTSSNNTGGGAMSISNFSAPLIMDCIFYNNTAINGGAIYENYYVAAEIINCSFYNNTASSGSGNAVFIGPNTNNSKTTKIANSILYGNGNNEIFESSTGYLTVDFSNIKGGYSTGTGNINTDPLFVNPSLGNLKLNYNSPSVQTGDNNTYSAYLNLNTSLDLAGNTRLSGNLTATGSNIDMGAYQYIVTAPSNLTYTSPNFLSVNESIVNLTPSVTGTPANSYTIQPNLPSGLNLNTITGVITGTPSQVSSPTIYTVTSSNIAGTTSGTIHLTIYEKKPNLTYTSPVVYTIGQTISPTLVPVNTGGEVTGGLIAEPFMQSLGMTGMTQFVFDNLGNMFILKDVSGEIYKRTPDGTMSVYASGVNAPEGITIDPIGNLYVISSYRTLYKVDFNGQVTILNQNAENNFISPRGIQYSNDGNVYIADAGSDKIIKVDVQTGVQTLIASNVSPSNTVYTGPSTLVFDVNNDLIVFNADNTISKVTLAGVVTQNYINTSDASLNYSYPNNVTKDADGNIYFNSTGNTSRIYKMNSIGDISSFSTLNLGAHLLKGIKFNNAGELFVGYRNFSTNFSRLYKYIPGKYIINPSLPAGLSFDNNTGSISGTPTVISPATDYTISATNTGGTFSTTVNLEVKGTILYTSSNVYTKGTAISSITPNTNGVSANTFSISPALPTGLSIDQTTGNITGTPTSILTEAEFTVSAIATGGNLMGKLKITVKDIPPSNLSYTTPNVYTKGVIISSLTPTVQGGTVVSYSITPDLPSGLSINNSTGSITGTPTTISASANYTVTAINSGGSVTANIQITVNDVAPNNLSYTSPNIYTKGTTIVMLSPTIAGGDVVSYSVNPSLPAGMTINALNGQITGKPTTVVSSSIYTVTATNSGGSSSFGIQITVNDIPPSGISYTTPNTLFKDKPTSGLTPTQSGGGIVTNYAIAPALPTGLSIDAITGVITGTSSVLSDPTDYTVTATNSGGSTTAVLNIKVILFLFAKDSILQQNNCINDSIGQILVKAEGGYAPYTYAINDGAYQSTGLFKKLPSGIYEFSLKDSTGAVVKIKDTIRTLSNVPIKISLSHINNTCFNDSLGKIIIDSVTGGVTPYSYTWSGGTVVPNGLIKLPKGNYSLNVTDFYGCQDSVSINITEPNKLVSTINVTQPSCYNQCNGILTTTTTGGTGAYTYLWSNGAVTSTINQLCSGVYSLTVKDSLGCKSSNTVNLINPLPFYVTLDSLVTICANQVYKKDFKNKNYPTANFSWSSDNGYVSSSSILSVNKAGAYYVKATNPNGCIASDTIVLKMQQNNIQSVFALATNVFKNDTIHIVNISMPRPDKSIWTYPIDTSVHMIYKNEDSLRLKFTNEGAYTIQLNTLIGACVDSSIQTIHIMNSSGINRYTFAPLGLNSIQNLVISPNPNRGQFNVSLKLQNTSSIAIRILNISNGKLVYSKQYPAANNFTIPFNLLLSADIYAFIIETEFGAVSVSKLLIL